MRARLRSWWQQIKQHRVAIGVGAIVFVVVIALIIAGYWFDWTGFNGYNKVTITHTISGSNAGTVTKTEEYQPGKALWDWMQLLFIPVVLAVAGFWFNQIQKDRDQKAEEVLKKREEDAAKEREKLERESREDNQRETALQAYIDKMSELLLTGHLRPSTSSSASNEEPQSIAQARTLTVLPRLDATRKGSVLRFLYESNLINKKVGSIVRLKGADLRGVKAGDRYSGANLRGADLSGAGLSQADLLSADLTEADLSGAHLVETMLYGATLNKADLRGAFLYDADLTLTILEDANLSEAGLNGAKLHNARLRRADLSGAGLEGASFKGASLRETDLREALLNGTDLSYANLSSAKITVEQLKHAKSLKGATLPDGSIYDE